MPGVSRTTTIPAPLARLYSHLPLVVLPAPQGTTAPPTSPTIWAYGPPPRGHKESLDPLCRAAQAFARFSLGDAPAQVRWLDWDGKEGAPGGSLPALHTPGGDLLVGDEVSAWVAAQGATKSSRTKKGGVSRLLLRRRCDSTDVERDAAQRPRPPTQRNKPSSPSSPRPSSPPSSPHCTSLPPP